MTTIHPKKAISTTNAPRPAGPYSQAIVAGDFIYTAGFGPQNPETGAIGETVAEQTRQVLRNIGAVLAEHDAGFDDIIKATVHLADLADFAEYNNAYREFFTPPYPVRTTAGSQLAGILVEIDVVARNPHADQ